MYVEHQWKYSNRVFFIELHFYSFSHHSSWYALPTKWYLLFAPPGVVSRELCPPQTGDFRAGFRFVDGTKRSHKRVKSNEYVYVWKLSFALTGSSCHRPDSKRKALWLRKPQRSFGTIVFDVRS